MIIITVDGKEITNVEPGKRDIAMVFQNYAIYPTMTVRANIEFGLKNRKVPKEERDKLIAEYSEIVGLTPMNALIDSAEYYLQIEAFDRDKQVLENYLL